MGRKAFKPLKKGMILIGRLVRAGDDWLVSGNLSAYPASGRDAMLAVAAEQALRHPEMVFRNPDKLAQARRVLAEHHKTFVDLFGADLIVVPGTEVASTVQAYHRHLAQQASPGTEPAELPPMDLPDDILDADSVAIYSLAEEGLSFYPDYDLLEELFSNPALISRRRYREIISGFLGEPDISPEALGQLGSRSTKASTVFTRLLKPKRGFRWEADGEKLLRKHKPSYFDGTLLPRTVVLPDRLSDALRRARAESH